MGTNLMGRHICLANHADMPKPVGHWIWKLHGSSSCRQKQAPLELQALAVREVKVQMGVPSVWFVPPSAAPKLVQMVMVLFGTMLSGFLMVVLTLFFSFHTYLMLQVRQHDSRES